MAPQRHGYGIPPWMTGNNEDAFPSSTTLFELPLESSLDTDVGAPVLVVVESPYYPVPTMAPPPPPPPPPPAGQPRPTAPPSNPPGPYYSNRPHDWQSTISTSTISSEYLQKQRPTNSTSLPTSIATVDAARPTSTDANGIPGWKSRIKDEHSNTPVYAAAAVIPVAVLAIIGVIVFVCLRRRKRRRLEAAAAAAPKHIQEMKAQSKPTMQPYMAPSLPPSVVLPNYSPPVNYSAMESTGSSRPIILGPIPSGTNGAYLTGIDTSDMVSVTSARDPFADGRSLEEPPPPYRPRSIAPSSIAPTSRHSSVRVAALPPAHSQTHLIERSPFDDPEEDNVSELSGHTIRRETDAMSVVSDLSYQIDPVVGRSSL